MIDFLRISSFIETSQIFNALLSNDFLSEIRFNSDNQSARYYELKYTPYFDKIDRKTIYYNIMTGSNTI